MQNEKWPFPQSHCLPHGELPPWHGCVFIKPTHVCVFVCVEFQILKGTKRINLHYYMFFSSKNGLLCINRCSVWSLPTPVSFVRIAHDMNLPNLFNQPSAHRSSNWFSFFTIRSNALIKNSFIYIPVHTCKYWYSINTQEWHYWVKKKDKHLSFYICGQIILQTLYHYTLAKLSGSTCSCTFFY